MRAHFLVHADFLRTFVEKACTGCSDVSCGSLLHVAWHFYFNVFGPEETGGYDQFQAKLDATASLMEHFSRIRVNEEGMLTCAEMESGDCEHVPPSGLRLTIVKVAAWSE